MILKENIWLVILSNQHDNSNFLGMKFIKEIFKKTLPEYFKEIITKKIQKEKRNKAEICKGKPSEIFNEKFNIMTILNFQVNL